MKTQHHTMRALAAFLAAALALMLGACSPSTSTPDATVKAFCQAVSDGKVDSAIDYIDLSDVSANDMTAVKPKLRAMLADNTAKENGGLASMTTTVIKEEKDTATVSASLVYKNGKKDDQRFNLRKIGSGWKIALPSL